MRLFIWQVYVQSPFEKFPKQEKHTALIKEQSKSHLKEHHPENHKKGCRINTLQPFKNHTAIILQTHCNIRPKSPPIPKTGQTSGIPGQTNRRDTNVCNTPKGHS